MKYYFEYPDSESCFTKEHFIELMEGRCISELKVYLAKIMYGSGYFYCQKYGEDNAHYLMETEQHWFSTYDRATFVDLGVGDTTDELEYTKSCAKWLGWEFDHQVGDASLLQDLLSGYWDPERFVVVPPGRAFKLTGDDRVVEVDADEPPRTT